MQQQGNPLHLIKFLKKTNSYTKSDIQVKLHLTFQKKFVTCEIHSNKCQRIPNFCSESWNKKSIFLSNKIKEVFKNQYKQWSSHFLKVKEQVIGDIRKSIQP